MKFENIWQHSFWLWEKSALESFYNSLYNHSNNRETFYKQLPGSDVKIIWYLFINCVGANQKNTTFGEKARHRKRIQPLVPLPLPNRRGASLPPRGPSGPLGDKEAWLIKTLRCVCLKVDLRKRSSCLRRELSWTTWTPPTSPGYVSLCTGASATFILQTGLSV